MQATITRIDKIIFALALLFLAFLYYSFWLKDNGVPHQVAIMVSGQKQYVLDLYEDRTVEVKGKLGISKLQISDGKIRFIESPCSSKFCIRSGWLTHAGGFAACLPNGVSVQLLGGKPTYDAINF